MLSAIFNDTDLATLPISWLVDKVKNASSSAKPFSTLVERPDAVGVRQPLHEPSNEMITDTTLILPRGEIYRAGELFLACFYKLVSEAALVSNVCEIA